MGYPFHYMLPTISPPYLRHISAISPPHLRLISAISNQVGYPFHYMLPTKNPKTVALVRRFAGSDAAAAAVQQVGPSPVLVQ